MSDTLLEYNAIPQVSLTEVAPVAPAPAMPADTSPTAPLETGDSF